jgi:hypothetical protein
MSTRLIEDLPINQLVSWSRNARTHSRKQIRQIAESIRRFGFLRLHAQTATIENGFVHLPEEAHWLADYISELTVFPAGRHDDQVDSTAQALAWTKIRPPGWGILEYYRKEAERLRSPIRLLAPEGISHVHGWSGRQYVVRERIVEVDPYDAPPLLRGGSRKNG